MDSFIDTHFVPTLERDYADVKFIRVDADLDDTLLDKEKQSEIVDPATNKTRDDEIKEMFEQAINRPRVNVKPQALKGEGAPPAMVLVPEAARRMQETMAMIQQQEMQFPDDHVLMVNTAHPLIQNLLGLTQSTIIGADGGSSPAGDLATLICNQVYDTALMAQKGFDADGMKTFVERSNTLLTKLTEQ
jgi:molecular chaperone HtpG